MPAQRVLLNDRQLATVDAYFSNGFIKEQAMLAGGYSKTTARTRPQVCFDNPAVQAEINRRKSDMAKKHELSQEWLVAELMKKATAGETLSKFKKVDGQGQLHWDFTGATTEELSLVKDLGVEFTKMGRGDGAIDVTKFKMKEPDDQAALMALGRHLGFFNDTLTISEGSLEDRIQAGRNRACKRNADDVKEDTVSPMENVYLSE